jgi:hypothetical protein
VQCRSGNHEPGKNSQTGHPSRSRPSAADRDQCPHAETGYRRDSGENGPSRINSPGPERARAFPEILPRKKGGENRDYEADSGGRQDEPAAVVL